MLNSIPQIIILVFSVVLHEVAHGQVALWKGDTTARDAGRLTLNPISHIDIFGTIIFPLFLLFLTQMPLILSNCVMSRQKWMNQNQTTSRDRCSTSMTMTPSPASRKSPNSSVDVTPCDIMTGM